MVVLIPLLLKFNVTPGSTFTRFLNRMPMNCVYYK